VKTNTKQKIMKILWNIEYIIRKTSLEWEKKYLTFFFTKYIIIEINENDYMFSGDYLCPLQNKEAWNKIKIRIKYFLN